VLTELEKKHTVALHNAQELDDDLGGRTDENLALASLLSVVDGVKRIYFEVSTMVHRKVYRDSNHIPLRTEVLTILKDYG